MIATVCTGSVLLAESGLLDGRSCACHWAYGTLFQEAYPRVRFRPEKVLELAHEADGIITGGGVTAWQDLALYLIARYCGPAHAAETAKVFLLDRHADGQLPYSAMTRIVRGDDAAIGQALDWIETTTRWPTRCPRWRPRPGSCRGRSPAGSWPRPAAGRSSTSTRCASRPRAASSRRAGPAVDDVGFKVGYEDPTFFRRLFRRATGMTPAAYRRKYAAIVPVAGCTAERCRRRPIATASRAR